MSLPRLHSEDLQEICKSVSESLTLELKQIFAKQQLVSEMQTLTVKDVARILNQHETTILRYISKKLIHGTKIGKDWIITQQSLTNFIDGK